MADEPGVERRLAAILAADVVGYSRLMEADEAGTQVPTNDVEDAAEDVVVLKGSSISL